MTRSIEVKSSTRLEKKKMEVTSIKSGRNLSNRHSHMSYL